MRVPIVVPVLGVRNSPLRLNGWFVDQDDLVLAGDLVAEVLIPGITFDIVAEFSGKLVEINKQLDAMIAEGDILGWIDDAIADETNS